MVKVMNRVTDLTRSRKAFRVADHPPTGRDLSAFADARQCVVVSFRRSGEAMPTPINHGYAEGKVYVRTDAGTGKVKRFRNDPRAILVPSTFRGRPKGEAVAATARIIESDDERQHADDVIAANWTFPVRVAERALERAATYYDMPWVYIVFTPAA